MLVLERRHLESVLSEYVDHYDQHRPHRSLNRRSPSESDSTPGAIGDVDAHQLRRTNVLGVLPHQVVDATDGWTADGRVVPVMVVEMCQAARALVLAASER